MARERVEPITEVARRLVEEELERRKLSQATLAEMVGVHRSVISRIVRRRQRRATISTLRELENQLGLQGKLRVQYEFDFEIDEEFAESAHRALREELSKLREAVGTVRGARVSGIVGLRVHGIGPDERVFQRVFAVRLRRRARA